MENGGVANEAPHAVWLGRMAAVMEARGDRDEAFRLYGQASTVLTGVGGSDHEDGIADVGRSYCLPDGACVAREEAREGRGFVESEGRNRDGLGEGTGLFPYSARAHHLASVVERAYRRHFRR